MSRFCWLIAFILSSGLAFGQSTEDYTVELSAIPSMSPVQITLKWKLLTVDTPTYVIWKKAKSAAAWPSTAIAILGSTDSTFTDTAVIVDSAYEYQVWAVGTVLTSTGYIYAGIRNPAIHNRGTLILMVDSNFTDSCAAAITTLMNDMSGDGWQIIRHDVSRNLPDTNVNDLVVQDYTHNPNVTALLLLGHIAVPYSGDFDTVTYYPPDGHVPYHDGAWPADVYYACTGGGWTDVTVDNVLGSYSANWNVPGDGKWDQVIIPSAATLEVSRVDFYNMPDFSASESQMMNNYLAKDHNYKMDSLAVIHRGLISDNFGPFGGEAFAANGFRNFAPLLGRDNVYSIAFISTLASSSYQWAYGCGGGSFTSAGGIGATTDFAANPVNAIFTMLFGSYFGDWNVQNDFMRAPLCSPTPALTCCWAGRPNWFFHHMALGVNIGYGAMITQNNSGLLYQPTGYGNQFIHVALMGDLTLRTDYINPARSLVITAGTNNGATLNWTASADPMVMGYYVYQSDSLYGYYTRLNTTMLTTTSYRDSVGVNGLKYYMVRPVKLQSTASGGYYNLGIGIVDTATISYKKLQTPVVANDFELSVFPNPAQNYLQVSVSARQGAVASMYITNVKGERILPATRQLNAGSNNYAVNISRLQPGFYTLVLETPGGSFVKSWIKE